MEKADKGFGWTNLLVKASYTVLSIISVALVLLYKYQDKMLYFPDIPGMPCHKPSENPEGYRNPLEAGNVPFEDVMVDTADGEKVHIWLMLQKQDPENAPTLIYFHGNAGNMGFRLPNSINMFRQCGMNILTMDYRGYGNSTGTPNEVGLELDADAVLQHALKHPKLRNSPIILFGRSLGGAVAISLAHKYPTKVAAIVVENTFLSIASMVDVLMPWVAFAKNLVLRIGWDSATKIRGLSCAMLFISGDADELVPPPQMKMLYELATSASFKDFYSVIGGGHNDSFNKDPVTYYRRLREFAYQVVSKTGRKLAGETCDDNDTPLVNQKHALPTMKTNFQVS